MILACIAKPKALCLNNTLREEFEQFCRANLMNERSVVEALLLHYLNYEAADDVPSGLQTKRWSFPENTLDP